MPSNAAEKLKETECWTQKDAQGMATSIEERPLVSQ